MSTNLPPGMNANDLPGARSTWECPHCSTEWPHEVERRECSVCGKTACIECLEDCFCGCGRDAHQACMAAFGRDSHGKRQWWRKDCLERHAIELEAGAAASLRIAEQAKDALRRAA